MMPKYEVMAMTYPICSLYTPQFLFEQFLNTSCLRIIQVYYFISHNRLSILLCATNDDMIEGLKD